MRGFDASGTSAAGGNVPQYTVSEISSQIKREIESRFGRVRVRGEVGRVVQSRMGHVYFDLKERNEVLSSVVWRSSVQRLKHFPEEGMEVIATGRLTAYSGQSRYQMSVESVEPAGIGALMATLEQRKKKLQEEGLFDQEHKRALPFLPDVIGVVTSPTGSVIRDILHRLRDRFPRPVLVWPVAVQGESCPNEVVAAIEGFNALVRGGPIPRPDVVIVARGGGSIEDLWGFNDEAVARAVFASRIPVISAIGHETDTTLIDHVADLRAPTPTAAAEHAVPVHSELFNRLASLDKRQVGAVARLSEGLRESLRGLYRALPNPADYVNMQGQHFDIACARLEQNVSRHLKDGSSRFDLFASRVQAATIERRIEQMQATLSRTSRNWKQVTQSILERHHARHEALSRLMHSLGYEATLQRGFALVRNESSDGAVVTEASAAREAPSLDIQFHDGHVQVRNLDADAVREASRE